MSRIVSRYVFRETVQVLAVVTVVLLVILLANQLAKVLGDAASNQLPRDEVFEVLALSSVQYLTILLPVSLFLAILLALGRLYRDSEMYALMACGMGPGRLYRPLLFIGLPLAALVAWLALVVGPATLSQVRAISRTARQHADMRAVEPGRFVTLGQVGAVAYAQSIGPNGHLQNVFVERRTADNVEIIVAEEAWQQDGAGPELKVLTFAHGRRYEGQPGSGRFRVAEFEEHGIPYSAADQGPAARQPRSSTVQELWASAAPADLAELQWRVSAPLTLIVLLVLAIPLAKAAPRQGRFTGLASGILIYISYANLLGAARVWVEQQRLPPALGLWWVHALFLAGALLLLVVRFGGGWSLRRLRVQRERLA